MLYLGEPSPPSLDDVVNAISEAGYTPIRDADRDSAHGILAVVERFAVVAEADLAAQPALANNMGNIRLALQRFVVVTAREHWRRQLDRAGTPPFHQGPLRAR